MRAVEEAIVAALLQEIIVAAAGAAHGRGSAIQRLQAAFASSQQMHADRRAHQSRLHEPLETAMHQNRPIATEYSDRSSKELSLLGRHKMSFALAMP
jgi:hypothetical protein